MEPERSPYDLQWRMFGTYVRVHPLFWLVSVVLGWSIARQQGLLHLVVWIVCVFASILLHEFGHVWMGRLFGRNGHIVLYGMGGLAIGIYLDNRWKRIAVSFAGPLIQFVLFGVLFGLTVLMAFQNVPMPQVGGAEELGLAALSYLLFINLYWPILNLFPIWPLDGGRISRDLLEWLSPQNGVRISLGISFVVAGLFAINALVGLIQGRPLIPYLPTGMFTALFFGYMAVGSYQAMQMENQEPPWKRYDP